ncbi:MAG: hypothetical protein RIE56_13875 [Amphiplicatus sp.]
MTEDHDDTAERLAAMKEAARQLLEAFERAERAEQAKPPQE